MEAVTMYDDSRKSGKYYAVTVDMNEDTLTEPKGGNTDPIKVMRKMRQSMTKTQIGFLCTKRKDGDLGCTAILYNGMIFIPDVVTEYKVEHGEE